MNIGKEETKNHPRGAHWKGKLSSGIHVLISDQRRVRSIVIDGPAYMMETCRAGPFYPYMKCSSCMPTSNLWLLNFAINIQKQACPQNNDSISIVCEMDVWTNGMTANHTLIGKVHPNVSLLFDLTMWGRFTHG